MENVRLKELKDLNLLDKFLFDEAMEDREIYQMVISILLENEIELLEKPETEKELRVSPGIRQVRLDVIGMDREGKLYYAEMQKRNTGNLIRRSGQGIYQYKRYESGRLFTGIYGFYGIYCRDYG